MLSHIIASSLLICAILLIRLFFRGRIPNRMIYALWIVVFIRLAVPGFAFQITLPETAARPEVNEKFSDEVFFDHEFHRPQYLPNASTEQSENTEATASQVPALPSPTQSKGFSITAMQVYLAGAGVVLAWIFVTELAIWRRLKKTRRFFENRNGINVYISDESPSPCVFGIIPSVYVDSSSVDSCDLELILMHEFAHIRQSDHIRTLARALILAVHWYNPLVWVYFRAASRDAELACDEVVTKGLDEHLRLKYAQIIFNYAPRAKNGAVGFGGKPMKKRILAITNNKKVKTVSLVLAIIMSLTVCVLAFTGCVSGSAKSSDEDVLSEDNVSENNNSESFGYESPEIVYSDGGEPILPTLEARVNEKYIRSCDGGMDYTYEELVKMSEDEISRMMLGPTTRYGFFFDYPVLKSNNKVEFVDANGKKTVVCDLSEDLFTYEWLVSEVRKYFSEDIAVELFSKGIYFECGEKLFMVDAIEFGRQNCGTKYEIVSSAETQIVYKATTKYLINDEDYEKYVMNSSLVFPEESYSYKYSEYVLSLIDGKWVFTQFEA